jgi:hypothetical protein
MRGVFVLPGASFLYLANQACYRTNMRHLPKYSISWAIILGFRLIPFRPANFEPITATLMPFGRLSGVANVLLAVASIAVYDYFTAGIGTWTWIVAFAFALIAVASRWYFTRVQASRKHYVGFAVVATLVFDALTGLTVGPLLFNQPLMVALMGQIPFTIAHLVGNIMLAAVLSPLIQRWIVENKALEFDFSPRRSTLSTN